MESPLCSRHLVSAPRKLQTPSHLEVFPAQSLDQ
uniref:Guanylate-binding protein 4-like isoform X3 n=1 Tax=Rhizophora mucronata TaxID=61149 RepID=A0A2P2PT05_RHIMU